jgi:UDP-glucose 4-epimerase
VLKWAAKKGKRVFVASTSEVYGKSVAVPFREDADLVLGPPHMGRWSYACSKLLDEFLTLAYYRERGLPATVVRFFNTVGPRQTGRYGMVVPRFVRAALRGEALHVHGSGKQTRCFTYVGDAVRALLGLMGHDESIGQVYNIGNPEEVSIEELAYRVLALTGSNSEVAYIPYEQAYEKGFEDMMRRVPSIDKIAALTGYTPTYDLDAILRAVIEFERAQL